MTDPASFGKARRARYFAIRQAQKWRKPLAAMAALFAVSGLFQTMLQARGTLGLSEDLPLTHPLTAATLI